MSMHLRKTKEVARYLGKDTQEIARLVDEDGLPCVRLPGPQRPSIRFRLADVFAWLRQYQRGGAMTLEDFVREFDEAQLCGALRGQKPETRDQREAV